MAKKKSGSKKDQRKAEEAAAAKKAQRKADEAAKKKATAKADSLAAEAKKARKAADKAAKAAEKAEAKAGDAAKAAGRSTSQKPDELSLAKLALRAAEAKLTATEHRLAQVQQELDGERRLQDEAVQVVLEDAVVDAAVEATVEEAVLEAVLEADVEDDGLDEALVVEAVAIDLDVAAEEADLPDEAESHAGDAAAAAEVFEDAGQTDDPQPVATEITPPLPSAPAEGEPSESWTLLQLRAEAKRRGLTGTSNLPKAALLGRLREG